jgi:hypothetical protein
MDTRSYLSGYADGEGCFCVTFNKSKRHKFGWEIRPSFSVSQNSDKAQVLKLFKGHFQCGAIRPDRSDKTLKYEVRSISDLVRKVIPHFEKYPLLSAKKKDFRLFSEICRKMYHKEHLGEVGMKEIIRIALALNPSGRKKFPRTKIKI